MIREKRRLLLKDLCARLPYRVIAHASEINKNGTITDVNISYNMVNLTIDNDSGKYELVPLFDIKPYLRPMSNMTTKELEEYNELFNSSFDAWTYVDWMNEHHFDYRGLIKKGLALEAPEDMYKIQ